MKKGGECRIAWGSPPLFYDFDKNLSFSGCKKFINHVE